MKLNELKPAEPRKSKKRVGRGDSSNLGKFSGRGNSGQKSRSGGSINPSFEGGQTPYFRRIPKKGFSNHPFKVNYIIVNLKDIEERFKKGELVDRDSLLEKGLAKGRDGIKILGNGDLSKALKFNVDKISSSAEKKILEAKGEIIKNDK